MKQDIIIFGASTRGVYVLDKLKDKYKVVAFTDNDSNKWGNKIQGIEIINPKELINKDNMIIIASQYYKEIIKQLQEMKLYNFKRYDSNIEVIFSKLQKKNIKFEEIFALETFGGTGESVDQFYVDKVKELDVWEIEKAFEKKLRENLPNANIKITDSFKEIKEIKKKYNMILMDNPMSTFGEHCQHFDMYMECFKVMRDECIVIFDIIPNLQNIDEKFEYIKTTEHLLSRKLFYRFNNPLNIPIEIMIQTYKEIANKNGFNIEWHFTEERSGDFIQYLVLKLKRV
ncbi:nucleoside-diphosphate sugar epimerase/dehydratase [Clostridium butyricum]|uniref:nucleoside-diphosphate sugar epimerase/dehydratase n=1 Tax=Clostridium butyricum TaxID=1492 RepID=UPI003D33267A